MSDNKNDGFFTKEEEQGLPISREDIAKFDLPFSSRNQSEPVVLSPAPAPQDATASLEQLEETQVVGDVPTLIRLASGEVVPRGRGRPPKNSVVVQLGSNVKPTEPVFVQLPDGTVKQRGRGRPPKGSVVVDKPTTTTP